MGFGLEDDQAVGRHMEAAQMLGLVGLDERAQRRMACGRVAEHVKGPILGEEVDPAGIVAAVGAMVDLGDGPADLFFA